MENNPYSSPSANLFGGSGLSAAEGVSAIAVSHLQKTKPWVRLFSVMLFLSALMILGVSAAMVIFSAQVAALVQQSNQGGPPMPIASLVGAGIFYGAMSLIYIYPAVKLWRYANRIRDLVADPVSSRLEAALDQQRGFWLYVGVWTIIGFCFMALGVVIMVIGITAAATLTHAK